MPFKLTILGSNSAIPAYGRNHTAQLLRIKKHLFLIDCGEGTQLRLSRVRARISRISRIFISHLHGDHYLGLIGLISSMHLQRRVRPLIVYGPKGLAEIITIQLKYSETVLNFQLEIRELNPREQELLFEDDILSIHSFPLNHKIDCCGFLFREQPKSRRINKEILPRDLGPKNLAELKKGNDILDESGKVIHKNEDLTLPPKKSRSYAYCSDTAYTKELVDVVKEVDLLYHESTFLDDRAFWAKETYHSTAKEAASFASEAKVDQLILGHFSARYRELEPFLEEARGVFPNSYLAIEGESFEIAE